MGGQVASGTRGSVLIVDMAVLIANCCKSPTRRPAPGPPCSAVARWPTASTSQASRRRVPSVQPSSTAGTATAGEERNVDDQVNDHSCDRVDGQPLLPFPAVANALVRHYLPPVVR